MDNICSLIDRASSASTLEEECDVIMDAVDLLMDGKPDLNALSRIVAGTHIGEFPRVCLLGVVAALVPEGTNSYVTAMSGGRGKAFVGDGFNMNPFLIPVHPSPALALLIAILKTKEAALG